MTRRGLPCCLWIARCAWVVLISGALSGCSPGQPSNPPTVMVGLTIVEAPPGAQVEMYASCSIGGRRPVTCRAPNANQLDCTFNAPLIDEEFTSCTAEIDAVAAGVVLRTAEYRWSRLDRVDAGSPLVPFNLADKGQAPRGLEVCVQGATDATVTPEPTPDSTVCTPEAGYCSTGQRCVFGYLTQSSVTLKATSQAGEVIWPGAACVTGKPYAVTVPTTGLLRVTGTPRTLLSSAGDMHSDMCDMGPLPPCTGCCCGTIGRAERGPGARQIGVGLLAALVLLGLGRRHLSRRPAGVV